MQVQNFTKKYVVRHEDLKIIIINYKDIIKSKIKMNKKEWIDKIEDRFINILI